MERPMTVHPNRRRILIILGITLAGILAVAVVTAMVLYIYVRKNSRISIGKWILKNI